MVAKKHASARRAVSDTAQDCLLADPLQVEELEFCRAAAAVDDSVFAPESKTGEWPFLAKPLFMYIIQRFREVVPKVDLVRAEEFHALLWLMVRLGGEQNEIAKAQHVSKTVVSRWVLAEQTPRQDRRRGILMSALRALELAIASANPPVPLRKLEGRRAEVGEPFEEPELSTLR